MRVTVLVLMLALTIRTAALLNMLPTSQMIKLVVGIVPAPGALTTVLSQITAQDAVPECNGVALPDAVVVVYKQVLPEAMVLALLVQVGAEKCAKNTLSLD
jgi:hypothetical protein